MSQDAGRPSSRVQTWGEAVAKIDAAKAKRARKNAKRRDHAERAAFFQYRGWRKEDD